MARWASVLVFAALLQGGFPAVPPQQPDADAVLPSELRALEFHGGLASPTGPSRLRCDGGLCQPKYEPLHVECHNANFGAGDAPDWVCTATFPHTFPATGAFVFRNITCETVGEGDARVRAESCALAYHIEHTPPLEHKIGLVVLMVTVFAFMFISLCPTRHMMNSGGTYDTLPARDERPGALGREDTLGLQRRRKIPLNVHSYPIDGPMC